MTKQPDTTAEWQELFPLLALRKNLDRPPVLLGFFERGFPGSTDRIRAWIAPEPMLAGA